MSRSRWLVQGVAPLISMAMLGCRTPPSAIPATVADVAGRVVSAQYAISSTGPGGLGRVDVRVDPSAYPQLPPTVHVRVDSVTRFVQHAGEAIDWTLPQLRGASVRVWFRAGLSTPTQVDAFATARLIVIDSSSVASPTR